MEGTRSRRRLTYNARTEDADSKYREIMRAQERLMDHAASDSEGDEIPDTVYRIVTPLQGKMAEDVGPDNNYRDSENGEEASGDSEDDG